MSNPSTDLNELAQRLQDLERRHRRLKGAGAVVLALVGSAFLMAQTDPQPPAPQRPAAPPAVKPLEGGLPKRVEFDVVTAKRFVLNDINGKVRMAMTVGSDGQAALEIRDSEAKPRAAVRVDADGTTALTFVNLDNRNLVTLTARADGYAFFELADKEGKSIFKQPPGAAPTISNTPAPAAPPSPPPPGEKK